MRTDVELAEAGASGDLNAVGDIYSRYGDRLHDYCWSIMRSPHDAADAVQDTFILAAERIGKLRDPSKLRAWLFSIARNECLRRMRDKSTPTDDFGYLAVEDSAVRAAEQEELATLVQDAAAGLDPRDRAVLDLQLRHGLDGEELADALGVKASHAYVLVGRVRERVERSLVSLIVARRGRDDCEELASILSSWDGTLSPLLRKRVSRHVESCEICERTRAAVVSPLALLAAAPLVVAPDDLRGRLISSIGGPTADVTVADRYSWGRSGFPDRAATATSRLLMRSMTIAAVSALAALGFGAGVWIASADTDPASAAAPPATLEFLTTVPATVAPTTTTTSTTSAPVTTAAVTTPNVTSAQTTPPPTTIPPTIPPTTAVSTTTTIPPTTSTTTIPSTTTTTTLIDQIGPVIADLELTSNTVVEDNGTGCFTTTVGLSATITDADPGLGRLELVIDGPRGQLTVAFEAVVPAYFGQPVPADRYEGQIGPFEPSVGTGGSTGVVATIHAFDLFGNESTAAAVLKLISCD